MSAAADQEAAARQQIEYYFSYANYSRDEYLRSLADADGYVALDALQDFPKLHKLTQGDGALLKRAAASSTRLEVSEDDKVRARRIGASSTGRQAQHLVLDANALVRGRGAALQAYADNFWTTTEVLAEVKDAESRARLAALPFRLETRRPSPQAVDRVSQFARKTGDLASLSANGVPTRVDLDLVRKRIRDRDLVAYFESYPEILPAEEYDEPCGRGAAAWGSKRGFGSASRAERRAPSRTSGGTSRTSSASR